MDRMIGPIGALPVGAVFICLCLFMTALAIDSEPQAPEALSEVMAYHSQFIHHSPTSDLGTLQDSSGGNLIFPWAKRLPQASKHNTSDIISGSPPTKEEIILRGSNHVRQSLYLGATDPYLEDLGEKKIDPKMKSRLCEDVGRPGESCTSTPYLGNEYFANNMNIDVSGISVRAVNTVPGGKAVATSNIVIRPVQIAFCPPEIEEKLK
jgi:hypothetical protein